MGSQILERMAVGAGVAGGTAALGSVAYAAGQAAVDSLARASRNDTGQQAQAPRGVAPQTPGR